MKTIDITTDNTTRKYVQVEERLLDLKENFSYEIKTDCTYFQMDKMFLAHAVVVIHPSKNYPISGPREYHGTANKKYGDHGYAESAASWAETIAIGRAYAKAFPDRLKDAGAELVAPEELSEEKPKEATAPLVTETIKKLRKKHGKDTNVG